MEAPILPGARCVQGKDLRKDDEVKAGTKVEEAWKDFEGERALHARISSVAHRDEGCRAGGGIRALQEENIIFL